MLVCRRIELRLIELQGGDICDRAGQQCSLPVAHSGSDLGDVEVIVGVCPGGCAAHRCRLIRVRATVRSVVCFCLPALVALALTAAACCGAASYSQSACSSGYSYSEAATDAGTREQERDQVCVTSLCTSCVAAAGRHRVG